MASKPRVVRRSSPRDSFCHLSCKKAKNAGPFPFFTGAARRFLWLGYDAGSIGFDCAPLPLRSASGAVDRAERADPLRAAGLAGRDAFIPVSHEGDEAGGGLFRFGSLPSRNETGLCPAG